MSPTRLGPYEIGQPLGKGGMGCVYRAVNVETGEKVAVKVLAPQLAMAEGFRERFEAEIDSLKTLRHEGIVRLYGWGEQDGALFYSMELVEGTSLEEELKAGRRFNWREVTAIAIQICKSLKHAHDHGIIHRDIKPANILLTAEERVKIADFGIARLFGSTQLTSAGGVLGTADYMSPEQADGRPVTARCDQYSLGGVMYALLAGRPPFRARTLPEMLQLQRFAEPEPVRRYAPQTPEQLEQAIQQLLSKNPADRFPNTIVVARHLEAMTIALSRPTNDDFELPHESAEPSSDPSETDLSLAVTQADPRQITQSGATDTQSGTVLQSSSGGDSISLLLANENQPASPQRRIEPSPAPAARFTTIEEELARRSADSRDSILATLLQWGGLLALLAAIVGGVWYATRPLSADALYQTIQSSLDRDGSLSRVGGEIDQFLARFPNDERASEIETYKRQLQLDRMARQMRLGGRGVSPDQTQSPVERLYLQAMKLAESDPEKAAEMLRHLIALYGNDGEQVSALHSDDPAESRRIADCLALAHRQLADMQKQIDEIAKRELDDLRARLKDAQELAANEPAKAKEIAAAIVTLYGSQTWAAPVVSDAKLLLEKL